MCAKEATTSVSLVGTNSLTLSIKSLECSLSQYALTRPKSRGIEGKRVAILVVGIFSCLIRYDQNESKTNDVEEETIHFVLRLSKLL
jgi:hypothetical protein